MPAFFGRREGDRVFIDGLDAGHLARSLRARKGSRIDVLDTSGFLLKVELDRVTAAKVEGHLIDRIPHRPEPAARITIAIANLPATSLDLVLSRCTEAGAFAFVVFQAERSVGRGERQERWSAICREAAMLAYRFRVPEVSFATSFESALAAEDNAVVLARGAPRHLVELTEPRDVTLFIGPEGGWSDRELSLAETTASLGPRNLRADTAALVALTTALTVRRGWFPPRP